MPDAPDDAAGDVAALEAEFPYWNFEVVWTAANSGADGRVLLARRGVVTLRAASADLMRRRIRDAGG